MTDQEIEEPVENLIEILYCAWHPTVKAKVSYVIARQDVEVCRECEKKVDRKDKKIICEHCHAPMKGDWRFTPLEGFVHLEDCPRVTVYRG